MRSTLRNIAFTVLALSSLYSCGPKEEVKDPIPRADMLKKGRWKLIEAYSNTEKNGEYKTYDIYNTLPECEKDNILKFNDTNYIEEDQGAIKCDSLGPQVVVKLYWALVGNSALEFIDREMDTAIGGHILELSDELLHIRLIGTTTDSTYFENTYKYEHLQ